jgi:hypothetical protein
MIISIALFYTAHWSTYCTGQLRFSKLTLIDGFSVIDNKLHFFRFDVTEAQISVIGVLIFTAIVGPGIWNIRVHFNNYLI